MRLKCLAGAYAGQMRDYSFTTGLAAIRSGTAARVLDTPIQPIPVSAIPIAPVQAPKKKPTAIASGHHRRM